MFGKKGAEVASRQWKSRNRQLQNLCYPLKWDIPLWCVADNGEINQSQLLSYILLYIILFYDKPKHGAILHKLKYINWYCDLFYFLHFCAISVTIFEWLNETWNRRVARMGRIKISYKIWSILESCGMDRFYGRALSLFGVH